MIQISLYIHELIGVSIYLHVCTYVWTIITKVKLKRYLIPVETSRALVDLVFSVVADVVARTVAVNLNVISYKYFFLVFQLPILRYIYTDTSTQLSKF